MAVHAQYRDTVILTLEMFLCKVRLYYESYTVSHKNHDSYEKYDDDDDDDDDDNIITSEQHLKVYNLMEKQQREQRQNAVERPTTY